MFKGLSISLAIGFAIIAALMGWQARGEVASIESRRAAVVRRIDDLKLSMQTRILTLQREAGLAMDTEGAARFVNAVTPRRSDLNAEMDRLVSWQSCTEAAASCKALKRTLAGSRHELWLMQGQLHKAQEDLEKVDGELAKAKSGLVW